MKRSNREMRRAAIILGLIVLCVSGMQAQETRRRGLALGADRDTLLYIIASPFDNWYLNVGGGMQTFIGNEVVAAARKNKLNFNERVEVGKWIIPDVAISLRLTHMNVNGQTKYGLNPFVDFGEDTPNENGYYPYAAHAAAALGFVTFDWTNFLNGYEAGKRKKLHVNTPVGLGMSMLYGTQINPRGEYEKGSFRRNFELAFSLGMGAEYIVNPKLTLNIAAELFGSESTWDWSPYDNAYSIFDLIPSVSVGMKFNLLKTVTKYNPYTRTSSREKVNHEFLAYGSKNTMRIINGRIDRLNEMIDSLQNQAGKVDTVWVDALANERDSLEDLADLMDREPRNIIDNLMMVNEVLGLPATVVYFKIDKYDLDLNARRRLQNFVKEVENMDDTVEFFMIGAADSATGTVRRNIWLSEHRCQVVMDMLTQQLGADPNQYLMVPVGGISDYEQLELNRMTMIIQRTPVTEAIVNHWLYRREE